MLERFGSARAAWAAGDELLACLPRRPQDAVEGLARIRRRGATTAARQVEAAVRASGGVTLTALDPRLPAGTARHRSAAAGPVLRRRRGGVRGARGGGGRHAPGDGLWPLRRRGDRRRAGPRGRDGGQRAGHRHRWRGARSCAGCRWPQRGGAALAAGSDLPAAAPAAGGPSGRRRRCASQRAGPRPQSRPTRLRPAQPDHRRAGAGHRGGRGAGPLGCIAHRGRGGGARPGAVCRSRTNRLAGLTWLQPAHRRSPGGHRDLRGRAVGVHRPERRASSRWAWKPSPIRRAWCSID